MKNITINELRWRCRRGMLELDKLLLPFVEKDYNQLSLKEQANFISLLESDDTQLLRWFHGLEKPENPDFEKMIQRILKAYKHS